MPDPGRLNINLTARFRPQNVSLARATHPDADAFYGPHWRTSYERRWQLDKCGLSHTHFRRPLGRRICIGDLESVIAKDERLSDAETAKLRDEVIKRMLSTPPQPRLKPERATKTPRT